MKQRASVQDIPVGGVHTVRNGYVGIGETGRKAINETCRQPTRRILPPGRTPDYLDPQCPGGPARSGCQLEAPFDQHQKGHYRKLREKELIRIRERPNRRLAKIRIKRVYGEPSSRDGIRILVDRCGPEGVTKKRRRIGAWRKGLAPSAPLRKWFGMIPPSGSGFVTAYERSSRIRIRPLR